MKLLPIRSIAILSLVGLLTPGASVSAQTLTAAKPPADEATAGDGKAEPPPQASLSPATTPYPVDIERIQEAVQRQPAVKLDDHQLRFYVLILAREPNFVADFAKNYDFRNGPTKRGAAMTNSEFLTMVTPRELNELLGSTSASSFAMFQVALMNAGAQSLIKKAIKEISEARSEREVRAIRERIERELAALNGGKD
jgi:hypothetical protein